MKMLDNIKSAYRNDNSQELDNGSVVEWVLIAGGIAIVTMFVVKIVSMAIGNKGADLAECVQDSSTISTTGKNNCDNINHATGNNDIKQDQGYKSRFGNG